jgi:hypothetical protein
VLAIAASVAGEEEPTTATADTTHKPADQPRLKC